MNFGLFGVQYFKDSRGEAFKEFLESDFVNVFLVGDKECCAAEETIKSLEMIHAKGKQCFLYFADVIFTGNTGEIIDVYEGMKEKPRSMLKKGWRERLENLYSWIRKKDYYDCVEGFYFDEPFLCGVRPQDFYEVTKALHDIFGKRIFCCFSVAGVAPDIWTLDGIPQIDEESGKYLTDIAFDMYHPFDEKYAYITKEMKRRIGRDDVTVWHIPSTMNYWGNKTEEQALAHLNGLYELLKEEKHPGGLMGYSYFIYPEETAQIGNIGLERLRGKYEGDADWKKFWNRMVEIGRELCQSKR